MQQIEQHPLAPFLPPHAKLLMLGSFPPPQKRWKMNFYYPNYQNDMWRIFGLIFFNDRDYFLDLEHKCFYEARLREFLHEIGVAIHDTAQQVIRLQDNAADKFLHIHQTTDLAALLAHIPACQHVMTTGDKATQSLMQSFPDATLKAEIGTSSQVYFAGRQLKLHRLPSSSRAYPLPLEQKAKNYAALFREIGLLK